MAYTFSSALQRVYTKLGMLEADIATGGSATTAVFSQRANRPGIKDNYIKDGVAFVIRTTDGLAPQGKYGRISAYVASTATMTFDTVTELVGAGDIIGFADDTYPFRLVIEMANQVLRTIKIGLTYTSITTAGEQTEYDLPVTVKRTRPSRVDIQTDTDTNDNQWKEIHGWEYVPATAGTVAKLILPYQPDSGYSLRVWYNGDHPTLDTYEDVVSETIDEELFASMITAAALEWYNTSNSGADQFLLDRENKANADVNQRKALNPTYTNKKRPKLLYGE
jgi:hypothetical protein